MEAKDERVDSFIERMVGLFGMGGFESTYEIPPPLWLTDAQLARMTRTIMEEVATEGNAIIVGRGGNLVLANHPRALHVFLLAPLEVRISRVMQAEGLSHSDAERRISGMDKLRTDYVHTFYHMTWNDLTQYHLVVNSGVWGEDGTTDLLAWALQHTS